MDADEHGDRTYMWIENYTWTEIYMSTEFTGGQNLPVDRMDMSIEFTW